MKKHSCGIQYTSKTIQKVNCDKKSINNSSNDDNNNTSTEINIIKMNSKSKYSQLHVKAKGSLSL